MIVSHAGARPRGDLRPMTEETARRCVGRLLDHDYAWIIEAGALIEQIALIWASLAIGIEDRAQLRKGLGSEAIGLVLGYAFNVLKLHRVSVRVVDFNLRAIRAYEKCGFSSREESASQRLLMASGMTTS
jgi:RimJ/RimL family protein N-acetyltransferase